MSLTISAGVLLLHLTLISNAAHHCNFAPRAAHRSPVLSQYIQQVTEVFPVSLLVTRTCYSHIH